MTLAASSIAEARWLKPAERQAVELSEAIIVKEFVWDLDKLARKWVRQHQLQALDDAACIAEAYMDMGEEPT